MLVRSKLRGLLTTHSLSMPSIKPLLLTCSFGAALSFHQLRQLPADFLLLNEALKQLLLSGGEGYQLRLQGLCPAYCPSPFLGAPLGEPGVLRNQTLLL